MLAEFSSTPRPSEEEIALAATAGDRDAVETLFRRFYPRVYSLCLRLLARKDQAHDCAQETFVRVLRAGVPHEARGQVVSWLFRIAANLTIDKLRRHHLEPLPADIEHHAAPGPILELEDVDRLRAGVAKLPVEFRVVVVLRMQQGWEYREIAEALGITANLARVRFFRALALLREMLQ